MLNFRRLLTRRWLLGVLGVTALLVGLAMLHPYARQSLFGPIIRGKPQCVWENSVRHQFVNEREPWSKRIWTWLGVQHETVTVEAFDHPEMLPVVVALLDDPNWRVRDLCMLAIAMYPSLQDRSALPALRKWFKEDEVELRLRAGQAIWKIDRDPEVVRWVVTLLDHDDPVVRFLATRDAATLSAEAPELYPHLVAHARDPDWRVRCQVMYGMLNFGEKGVPTLIAGINDVEGNVRDDAIYVAKNLGPDAKAAVPALQARLRDADPNVAHVILNALEAIDPERFRRIAIAPTLEK